METNTIENKCDNYQISIWIFDRPLRPFGTSYGCIEDYIACSPVLERKQEELRKEFTIFKRLLLSEKGAKYREKKEGLYISMLDEIVNMINEQDGVELKRNIETDTISIIAKTYEERDDKINKIKDGFKEITGILPSFSYRLEGTFSNHQEGLYNS